MPLTLESNEKAIVASIAGVILAAGESKRFGSSKQLLEFHGKTFIENIVEAALYAELSPVVVVVGENADQLKNNLARFETQIEIIENLEWQEGQSASIRVAVNSIKQSCQAAIFLLVDQPQITTGLITSLKQCYTNKRVNIVAPYFDNKRGNPVLFSSICFSQLQSLNGNQGGRVLFSEFEITKMEWNDPSILFDIDSPEDYEFLKREYESGK